MKGDLKRLFRIGLVLKYRLEPENASFLLTFLALMFVIFVPSRYIAGKFGRRKTI